MSLTPAAESALANARAAVVAARDVLLAERADLVSVLAAAEAIGRLADDLRVRAAGPVAHDALAAERLGYASATDAIASISSLSSRTARMRLALARATTESRTLPGAPVAPRYPHLAHTLAEGNLGLDAAALIAHNLDAVHGRVEPAALTAAEQLMVSRASSAIGGSAPLSVDSLAIEIHQVAATIDPDGARPREERAVRRRAFQIGQQDSDGLIPVHGRLLPEVGGLLAGLLEAHRRSPRFRDDASLEGVGSPEGAIDLDEFAAADPRTPDQRRHDAFAEVVTAAASAEGAPRLDGHPVTVVVSVDLRDLATDGLDGDGIGTMAGSRFPLSRVQVHRLIDGSGFRLAGIDAEGAVAGISSVQRCFTATQRLAIAARDGLRCATPGCTSPHYALQVHHVTAARDGGPTHTVNGILLCYWHHRRVDDGPWEYRMVSGRPEVRGPGILEWTPLRGPLSRAA